LRDFERRHGDASVLSHLVPGILTGTYLFAKSGAATDGGPRGQASRSHPNTKGLPAKGSPSDIKPILCALTGHDSDDHQHDERADQDEQCFVFQYGGHEILLG
jgi:hypothetical protein